MVCHYVVVHESFLDDVNARTTYGIAAVKEYDGCAVVMERISDVCWRYLPVEELVKYCNRVGLDLVHLHDVVDDFLTKVHGGV